MTETTRDQRLAQRIEHLFTTDPQFRAAAPLQKVTDAAHRPGVRLWEVIEKYLTGYADRPALGQRAREVTRGDATGRAITTLLSGFDTITYRQLHHSVSTLSSAWQSGLSGGFQPGDFVAVLGFTRSARERCGDARTVDWKHPLIRSYKTRCVTRHDGIGSNARTPEDLVSGLGTAMAATLRDEAAMHRLWYDLRTQTMFEPAFSADVTEIDRSLERMIWRIVSRYAELLGVVPVVSSEVAYAMFDGCSSKACWLASAVRPPPPVRLSDNVEGLLLQVVPPPAS